MIEIFAADDPLVLNGTYDTFGYKPGERARIAKAKARQEALMADGYPKKTRKKKTPTHRVNTHSARNPPSSRQVAPPGGKTKRPRSQPLPGMEDRAIAELEDAAHDYALIRDQRMALNTEEAGLKAQLLRLMKTHRKQSYSRDGISIEIVVEEETVKVRIKKAAETDGEVEVETAPEETVADAAFNDGAGDVGPDAVVDEADA